MLCMSLVPESVHGCTSELCYGFDLLVLSLNWISLMLCLVAEKVRFGNGGFMVFKVLFQVKNRKN